MSAVSAKQIARLTGGNRRQREAALRSGSGGGGGKTRLRFDQQYRPTTGRVPDVIRLIPGDYVKAVVLPNTDFITEIPIEYWPYRTHWDARHKRFIECSAGPYFFDSKRRDKCHACDEYWNSRVRDEKTGKMTSGYINRSEMAAFSLIHFHPYHEVPQLDVSGKPVMSKRDNKVPYKEWVRCTGRDCRFCHGEVEVFSTVQARQMYWSMSPSTKQNLFEDGDTQLEGSCKGCGGNDTIEWESWACPKCGMVFFDETSQFSDDRIMAYVEQLIHCPQCEEDVYAIEHVNCSECGLGVDELHPASRASIYDANLRIRGYTTGESKALKLNVQAEAVQPIPAEFAELAVPLKLNEMFAPMPLDKQSEILGLAIDQEDPSDQTSPYVG